MRKIYLIIVLFVLAAIQSMVYGQPAERLVQVMVVPNHADWLYKPKDKVKFTVAVLRCHVPLRNLSVRYELSEDMMRPYRTGTAEISNKGEVEIDAGTALKAGFLRCRVFVDYGGYTYEGIGTVGCEPEKLQPVTTLPDDFDSFWEKSIADARKWPLEPIMTLLPERCTDKVDVYHVSFANNDYASRMYGILCIPKAPGQYPAILKVPGAGVRAYNGEADRAGKGFIILELGIHGIPVNLTGDVYHRLYNGALKGYHSFNMNDRDRYYYKRVYTGCIRAIDFLYTLTQFNGKLATFGGSQGGALSIVIAGLDKRVNGLVSYYPALCDMAGYAYGRAGGWPHTLRDGKYCTEENLATLRYFDVVNFARHVTAPGFYTFGYNDMVCPPTTTYSAYNMIRAPKELFVAETTGHYAYAEQGVAAWRWVMDFLKKDK